MKKLLSLLIVVLCFTITLCGCEEKTTINNTYTTVTLMEGTDYETVVYKINSNKEGPKFVIVGGIHGDETSGYIAATKIKDQMIANEYLFYGECLIIPRANELAISHNSRRWDPFLGSTTDETYNLNRTFPGKEDGTLCEKLALEITDLILEFDASVFIDLHESKYSHTQASKSESTEWLGETIIHGNLKSSLASQTILESYNSKLKETGLNAFDSKTTPKPGSFNEFFSGLYSTRYKNDSSINQTSYYNAAVKFYSYTTSSFAFTIEVTKSLGIDTKVNEHLAMVNEILTFVYSN